MTKRSVTREMPRLELRAEIAPATLDAEKRTVQLVWTTGARVLRGFFDRYWEELSLDPKHVRMDRLRSGAPLLDSHNADNLGSVIGVVESASLEKNRGIATVRFDRGPEGEDVFRKVADGIVRNVSVGYSVFKMEKVEDGKDKIPVYRAVDWQPAELSMVPIGADAGAGTRSATTNPCVFIQEQRTMDPDDTNEQPETPSGESPAITATRAAERARQEELTARSEAERSAAKQAVADERARIAEIRKLARSTKLGDTWAQTLIEAGTSVVEARAAALEHLTNEDGKTPTDGILRIGAGDDARDKWIHGATAWLLERAGARKMLETAKGLMPEQFSDVSFDPGEFRGLTPVDLARASLERRGVSTRGMDRMRMVGMAFTHRDGNYQTTSDFAVLLENVLGKVLLGAYAVQPNTWERIAKRDQVPDFRNSNRYRTGSIPGLDVILEHGEYTNGKIPDGSKYGISAQRMGKIFGLSREAIVNDDMGALTDLATKFGQASMRSIENAVYALINANSGLGPTQTDAQPFFNAANRANINATGSALSVLGIEADAVVLANQKDPNALDFLDLQPSVLLVPRALLGTAKEINDSAFDFDAAGTNNKFMRPNRVRGLFQEVVGTPRLTGTRRYLIAEPRDWIVVAFLEGYGGPVLESQQGWRIDGVEWKVTIYAKAQMGDPKAAVTNAGV